MRATCVLLTYNRLAYAKETLRSFYEHVTPKVPLHIADDGSPDGYVQELVDLAGDIGVPSVSCTNSDRGGYGRNVNLATQVVHNTSDYVFMLEDDWQLRKPLDLAEFMEDMETLGDVDCVRLGYLSWTQPMWGRLLCGVTHKYILLDPSSAEPHVFAGHPRLERVQFQRAVGEWPEGMSPGQTEFTVAHLRRARSGIAWPLGLDPRQGYGYFAHIGSERSY